MMEYSSSTRRIVFTLLPSRSLAVGRKPASHASSSQDRFLELERLSDLDPLAGDLHLAKLVVVGAFARLHDRDRPLERRGDFELPHQDDILDEAGYPWNGDFHLGPEQLPHLLREHRRHLQRPQLVQYRGEELPQPFAPDHGLLEPGHAVDDQPLHLAPAHGIEEALGERIHDQAAGRLPDDLQQPVLAASGKLKPEIVRFFQEPRWRLEESEVKSGLLPARALAQEMHAENGLAGAGRTEHEGAG